MHDASVPQSCARMMCSLLKMDQLLHLALDSSIQYQCVGMDNQHKSEVSETFWATDVAKN